MAHWFSKKVWRFRGASQPEYATLSSILLLVGVVGVQALGSGTEWSISNSVSALSSESGAGTVIEAQLQPTQGSNGLMDVNAQNGGETWSGISNEAGPPDDDDPNNPEGTSNITPENPTSGPVVVPPPGTGVTMF